MIEPHVRFVKIFLARRCGYTASNKFVFHDAENELFKEICKELNDDDKSKYAPKPDIPGVARLLHDPENHYKLSRWVYKHASEWAGEDSYKAEVKDFLEKNAKDTDEAKEMARRKYDRLEAKIANLAWWKEVSKKVKDFPSSPVVYHFNPTAFLEQMLRVEGESYLSYVRFSSGLEEERQNVLSRKSIEIIGEAAKLSGHKFVTITSTIRYPEHQATAMYNNLSRGKNMAYKGPAVSWVHLHVNMPLSQQQNSAKVYALFLTQLAPTRHSTSCS